MTVQEAHEKNLATETYDYEQTQSATALLRERQLEKGFRTYLASCGHESGSYRIKAAGGAGTIETDIADKTAGVLYEAKGRVSRMSVQLTLGQVLDYGRYLDGYSLAVLLPELPPLDMVALFQGLDIGCVVELRRGNFADTAQLGRCPSPAAHSD